MKQAANKDDFDVCIVGAGPAGLACLSAIREPYSIDHLTESQTQRAVRSMRGLHRQLRVCVIDPQPGWLHAWQSNFERLRIEHLRSPALAHPDTFDVHALLAFACQQQRDQTELHESGCFDVKQLQGLYETHSGLWKLPSSKLFLDFCQSIAQNMPHQRIQGHVVDVDHSSDDDDDDDDDRGYYKIHWCDHNNNNNNNDKNRKKTVFARHLVFACGMTGRMVVPPGLEGCPRFASWREPRAFPSKSITVAGGRKPVERVLVVGGGLTAVQTALRVVNDGHECVLCSRRPLQEKHFDLTVEWFDRRTANHCRSDIYHDNDFTSRLQKLKEARDGGSVPPMYMKQLADSNIKTWVGQVEYKETDDSPTTGTRDGVHVLFQGLPHVFDRVVLACGVTPDCTANPVLGKVVQKWPVPVHGGLPLLTEDLQWNKKTHPNLFVVGALAALQMGPDAGNLMGLRRAATVVANAL